MTREEIIKGLEEVQHYIKVENLPAHTLKAKLVIDDALALLKTQEPRLVTYNDFHSGREDGGEAIPCWKEARSKTRRSGWAVIVYGKMLADRETGVARYWTARPTEEQMREEPWPGV